METVVCTGDCGTESNIYLHTGELLKVFEGADDILKTLCQRVKCGWLV